MKQLALSVPMISAALGSAAVAQSIPGAGSQLQQLPPVIDQQRAAPDIRIDRPDPAPIPAQAGPAIAVTALRVTGATVYPEATLVAAAGFTPGTTLSFADLQTMAARITAHYTDRGYFVARAYLPAQDVSTGTVTIAVIEGRYGAVSLNNSSRLAPGVANGILAGLNPGDIVAGAPLERRLLILSDVPGISIGSTLSPGTAVGTSDLRVDIAPGDTVSGVVEADNGGNRYTGEWRGGGTLFLNNLAGRGDQLSLRVLASTQSLIYGRVAWQAPVGAATVGVAYSHIGYELGREFASLDASGTADIVSVFATYPLLRSRRHNVRALLGADAKWFTDRARTFGTESDRTTRVLTAGLAGDHRHATGFSTWSVSASYGDLTLKTPADRAFDALTARAEGGYGVFRAMVSHDQTIIGGFSLFGSARGQLATRNLDSSEKMQLGGAYGIRAYPEGEAFGDEGYIATAEARQLLAENFAGLPGRLQLFAFIETGAIRLAKTPWFPGDNILHRSGYGAGAGWVTPGNFTIRAAYARKLGTGPATSAPDRSGRFWLQVAKFF
ncbi:ShlB/FhaC/HecB family hemolysin secretion/activation protein [Polymorphobacter sp.]|uniref:ShlB/FhaC/HecB family hemolysin secretion/activation protein n=1 Tax=Polymorphobacter sp. TaxID=1909290 RepID=UPI003F729F8E